MDKQLLIVVSLVDDMFFSDTDLLLFENYFTNSGELFLIAYSSQQDHSMLPRKINCDEWLTQYSNLQFFQLFRMEKTTMNQLVNVVRRVDIKGILSKKYTGGHYPVNIDVQVLVFLWYMSSQDSLLHIGNRFRLSPTTVMNIVNRLLYFLLKLKNKYIKFPKREEEFLEISQGFTNYPGVIGVIDGTHIFVNVEKEQQDSYIDRYRRHSINIMGICESNKLFTYVFAGFPGSAHDARVFENSLLYREIEENGPNSVFIDDTKYHLIGDSAFGLKKWLMTPYKAHNNLTRREKHHNYCLSSERIVIEHTFGALKGRWRRTQYINTYNICKTVEIATAACVLHNFCILNADIWNGDYFYDEPVPIAHLGENQREGKLKRDRIANDLFI